MKQFFTKKNDTSLRLNFNLKQMKDTEKLTQIMLVTTVNRQRIRVYTKLRVEPKYWDTSTHRCKTEYSMNLRNKNRLKQLNRQLYIIEESIIRMDKELAEEGKYLSSAAVRKVVKEKQTTDVTITPPIACLYKQVDEYLKNMNRRGKRGNTSTQRTYYTALKRLEQFCSNRKQSIKSFDDFDKKFFDDFSNYLYAFSYRKGETNKQYTQNTVINTLKVIKNLLHRAYDNEMTDNNYYQRVQTTLSADVSDQVYLQEKEIKKIMELKKLSSHELHVRDMFVISCYTALRISDIKQLDKAVIHNGIISLYQAKTKEKVEIPIFKEISSLVSKYQSEGFPFLDPCKANKTIKNLAFRCGINEIVNYKENRGGESYILTQPKWKMISFHTARRSCITNLYKRGYPINYIMTLSGHRSVNAFQRYMRASSKELMNNFVELLKKERAI